MIWFFAVETANMRVICKDTPANWKETFEFLKSEGIAYRIADCSDYSGPSVESDQIFLIHHGANNPAPAPHWMRYR